MVDLQQKPDKLVKGDLTRQKILDVSLGLFLKQGYEKATMREIAKVAGLAPGAAYYHFSTKEHIIFEFYEKSFEDHLPQVERVFASKKSFQAKIAGVIEAHMEVARPFHEISKILLQTAVHPDHPLSPFSQESKPLREKNIDIFRKLVSEAGPQVPQHLKEGLPEILWLFKMGIILYWIYDRSPDQKKTFELIDRGSGIITKLVTLSKVPLLKGFSEQLLKLFHRYKTY